METPTSQKSTGSVSLRGFLESARGHVCGPGGLHGLSEELVLINIANNLLSERQLFVGSPQSAKLCLLPRTTLADWIFCPLVSAGKGSLDLSSRD